MRIYNSLSRQVEEFRPLRAGKVGMYTCGPTVYDYDHIGHAWKYVHDDLLRRLLTYNGYEVKHVQNITDVGHLVSDADEGEDKMEKGARRSGKTVWETAKFFTEAHFESMDRLNVLRPHVSCKATEHIPEQIELVSKLLAKGFAYDTPEAVYFEVGKFPGYSEIFGMQAIEEKKTAAREEVRAGEHKRHPADFVLWFKRVGRFANHVMHWESPFGDGFPGWHVECSAMSMKYLGTTFDIHTGGVDHIPVHHPNEIAQSEAATGKRFARYWVHYSHVMVDGAKMSKSLNNFYRVEEVMEKGFSPLALRYLYLTAHYRNPLNFTWSALASAQSAYDRLTGLVAGVKAEGGGRAELSAEKFRKLEGYRERFLDAVNDDMGFPVAIAVMWEMIKSNVPDYDKVDLLMDWDQILGLGLGFAEAEPVPEDIRKMGTEREALRLAGRYVEADELRVKIEKAGWALEDTKAGPRYKRLKRAK